jgi:CheY-like chemotaxis protein
MRVLYIDDDRVNALLFAEVCRLASGVEVQTAFSAAEALAVLDEFAAELLVVDLHLPDGNGIELLPRLRDAAGRALPAYLCTAEARDRVEALALAAGFAGCWDKPLDVPQVLAQLSRHAPPAAA